VLSGATVDASGESGGGRVQVGGDKQAHDSILNAADTVTVTTASTIRADALRRGDGGQGSLWAEQATAFDGTVSARGGPTGGSGGFIDVSGRGNMHFGGSADAGASSGQKGALLLDPKNLTIDATSAGPFPQFDLIDPHPTAGNGFGTRLAVLRNGNV